MCGHNHLTNEDILVFGNAEWFHVPSLPEHTVNILVHNNKVLYIEPFDSLLSLFYSVFNYKKKIKKRFGITRKNKNLFIYSPPPIRLPLQQRFPVFLKINAMLLSWLVKGIMRKIEFKNPILWIFRYHLHGLIGSFCEKVSIYECQDQEEAFLSSSKKGKNVRELEGKLCKKVDIVFAISPELYKKKIVYNPNTFIVQAGANYDHFIKANDKRTQTPSELLILKHPILGYMGQIDPWKIDIQLLVYLAHNHPEWSIVLVGFPHKEFEDRPLKKFDNIHIIGSKPYEEIPSYIKGFDVCLMPFLINEATIHGDHLKLYEYMAAGKPIVSTAVSSAKRFKDLVYVSNSHEEFVKNVEAAYQNDHPELIQKRMDVARSNSWDVRVAKKNEIILQIIQNKVIRSGIGTGG